MRFRLLATALLVGLAGCHHSTDDTNNADKSNMVANDAAYAAPTDIPSMLKAGAPELCTNDDVEHTLFSVVTNSVKTSDDIKSAALLGLFNTDDLALAIEQTTLSLDAVTFEGADQDIGRVSCNGNLIMHAGGALNTDNTKSVHYDIRTSLTPGEPYVLNSSTSDARDDYLQIIVQLARQNAVDRVQAAAKATQQQPAGPIATNPLGAEAPSPQTAPDDASSANQQ